MTFIQFNKLQLQLQEIGAVRACLLDHHLKLVGFVLVVCILQFLKFKLTLNY